jgi:hypothetical protein
MLFGPGGIAALVLGGWSVIWALWVVPGRPWPRWAPVAVMFVGAMIGVALLTACAETALGLVEWLRAAPGRRPDVLAETVALPCRPILGTGLGVTALGVALAVATREAPPADAPADPDAFSVGVAVVVACLSATGLLALLLLRTWIGAADAGVEQALAALPRVRFATGVGLVTAYGALSAAAAGALRQLWLARY